MPHRHPLKLVPWLDLGKSESTAGLTFVCLSRAKRLVDLLIEPMPLERLSKIGDTPTFQLRLREEVRLKVAVNTIVPRSPFFLFLYLKTQTVTHIRKNAVEYLRQWNGAICVIYNLCQRQKIR